jgi:hypothetical protein
MWWWLGDLVVNGCAPAMPPSTTTAHHHVSEGARSRPHALAAAGWAARALAHDFVLLYMRCMFMLILSVSTHVPISGLALVGGRVWMHA